MDTLLIDVLPNALRDVVLSYVHTPMLPAHNALLAQIADACGSLPTERAYTVVLLAHAQIASN